MLWKALRSRVRSTVIRTGQMVVVRHHTKAFYSVRVEQVRRPAIPGNGSDTVRVEQVRRPAFPGMAPIPCV